MSYNRAEHESRGQRVYHWYFVYRSIFLFGLIEFFVFIFFFIDHLRDGTFSDTVLHYVHYWYLFLFLLYVLPLIGVMVASKNITAQFEIVDSLEISYSFGFIMKTKGRIPMADIVEIIVSEGHSKEGRFISLYILTNNQNWYTGRLKNFDAFPISHFLTVFRDGLIKTATIKNDVEQEQIPVSVKRIQRGIFPNMQVYVNENEVQPMSNLDEDTQLFEVSKGGIITFMYEKELGIFRFDGAKNTVFLLNNKITPFLFGGSKECNNFVLKSTSDQVAALVEHILRIKRRSYIIQFILFFLIILSYLFVFMSISK